MFVEVIVSKRFILPHQSYSKLLEIEFLVLCFLWRFDSKSSLVILTLVWSDCVKVGFIFVFSGLTAVWGWTGIMVAGKGRTIFTRFLTFIYFSSVLFPHRKSSKISSKKVFFTDSPPFIFLFFIWSPRFFTGFTRSYNSLENYISRKRGFCGKRNQIIFWEVP